MPKENRFCLVVFAPASLVSGKDHLGDGKMGKGVNAGELDLKVGACLWLNSCA